MKCKVVAITGKIASGKSTVCSYLKSKGFVVVDCDKIAKEVLHQETVKQKVQNLLGITLKNVMLLPTISPKSHWSNLPSN